MCFFVTEVFTNGRGAVYMYLLSGHCT